MTDDARDTNQGGWVVDEAIGQLLLDTLDRPCEQRDEFLNQATDDPAVRAAVKALLAEHARADAKVRSISERIAGDAVAALTSPMPERAGAYRLGRKLGQGGMSVVYLGERDDGQFEQTVAIKLLPTGPAMPTMARRFESERRLLARLDHPNIARLIDGGITQEGWPYLVMDFVDGRPITEYCDQHELDLEQRLALFRQVLEAVQYAHRNLVVHRDLKPSNILVTPDGVVKLLDFGIAKVLDEELQVGEATELTHLGGRPMTPAWASPEQVAGGDITTASDVYTLGVLLYWLLTGRSPYGADPNRPQHIREAVVDTNTVLPSRQVIAHTPVEDAVALARLRKGTPRRLARRLKGDLDTICLVAMRKDPARRYATVEQLAADIDRHLMQMPIRARPDGRLYRIGKFLQRHPVGVTVAVVFPILVISGLLVHADRLQTERDRASTAALAAAQSADEAGREAFKAERISQYLVSLFEAADPYRTAGETVTAHDLLKRGREEIDQLSDEPLVKAEMLRVLGQVERNLGQYDSAEALLRHALVILEEATQATPSQTAMTWTQWGLALDNLARYQEAREAHETALSIVKDEDERRRILNNLGSTLNRLGEHVEAERMHRDALAIAQRLHPGAYEEGLSHNSLGNVLFSLSRYEEALPHFQQVLSIREESLGRRHPDTAIAIGNVAGTLMFLGDFESSHELYREAIQINREGLGSEHPRIAAQLHMAGLTRWRVEDIDSARTYWEEALRIRQQALDPEHPSLAVSLNAMAALERRAGNFDKAEALIRQGIANNEKAYGDRHAMVGDLIANLGSVYMDRRDFDRARQYFDEALDIQIEHFGKEHGQVVNVTARIGWLEFHRGDLQAAEEKALSALDLSAVVHTPDHPAVRDIEELLAEIDQARTAYAGVLNNEQAE
jgi:eukaryotic-like serine/threonine-protein kinase